MPCDWPSGERYQIDKLVRGQTKRWHETIADTKAFKQLQLKVEGPVDSISYTNLADDIRRAARFLEQAGTLVPMLIGIVGAQAKPEDLKPVQEVLGLLPSVGKIVSKFDFLEARLAVTQAGDQPDTYQRRSVTMVRPAVSR